MTINNVNPFAILFSTRSFVSSYKFPRSHQIALSILVTALGLYIGIYHDIYKFTVYLMMTSFLCLLVFQWFYWRQSLSKKRQNMLYDTYLQLQHDQLSYQFFTLLFDLHHIYQISLCFFNFV